MFEGELGCLISKMYPSIVGNVRGREEGGRGGCVRRDKRIYQSLMGTMTSGK